MTTTYNVIRHNESDTQEAESIWGAYDVDESAAPNYGGTATVEDLKKTYQGSTTLQQTFGSFENYLGYMTEASEMLGQQNWWNAEGIDQRTPSQIRREEEDLSRGPAQDTARDDLRQSNYNARQSQYQQWLMSEQNQALMQKYGIAPTITNEKGDKFHWTGSGYVRTYKEDRSQGADIAKAILIGMASYGVGQVVSGALAGAGGAAGGGAGGAAGVAAPTATSGSSIANSIAQATGLTTGTISSAAGAMVGNAAGQLLLTGEINPADMLTAGFTAGILEVADALQYMDPALAESVPLGFVDDQVNNLADLLHTDYNTALDIAKSVAVGAIEGGDLQGIVAGAAATLGADYITDTIQETIGTTVPNFFEEGTTTINPNAVEEVARIVLRDGLNGELDAGTLMSAGLGYIRNDGTFSFMDPSPLFPEVEFGDFFDFLPDFELMGGEGFDIDIATDEERAEQALNQLTSEDIEQGVELEPSANVILQYDQNTVDQIENILKEAKEAGSEFNQAVIQPIVDVIQEAGYAVDDYVLQPIKEAAESLWNALPDLPEGPQTNLPSLTGRGVNIPVDADTPSFSLSDINFNRPFGEEAARFSPLTAGAMAQQVQLLSPVQVNTYDPTRFGSPIVSNLFSEYIK
jgi:hypothetical protein